MKTLLEFFLKLSILAVALTGCAGFTGSEKGDSSEKVFVETQKDPVPPSASLEQEAIPQKQEIVQAVDVDGALNSPEIAEENTSQAHADQVAVSINEISAEKTPYQSFEQIAAKGYALHQDLEEESKPERSGHLFP